MTEETSCARCGQTHDIIACPHVKAVEFDGDSITRIEFLTPVDYPQAAKPEPSAVDGDGYPRIRR
jgi:hypothetical protein